MKIIENKRNLKRGEKKRIHLPPLKSPLGITLIVVIAVIVALTVVATVYQFRNGGLCLMLSLMGIPCPSCGLTRATLCALTGRINAAFSYHPLFFVPYIMVGVGICSVPMKKFRKQLLAVLTILVLAMLICWIVRLALGWRGYVPI